MKAVCTDLLEVLVKGGLIFLNRTAGCLHFPSEGVSLRTEPPGHLAVPVTATPPRPWATLGVTTLRNTFSLNTAPLAHHSAPFWEAM